MRNDCKVMWALVITILVLLTFHLSPAEATEGTSVGGEIKNDTTWKLRDSPFHVEDDVEIVSGAKLTIEAGVEVLFEGGLSIWVYDGELIAEGTVSKMIQFKTNPQHPWVRGWGGIKVYEKGRLDIKFCSISNAGNGVYLKAHDFEKGTTHNNIEDSIFYHGYVGIVIAFDSSENYIARNNISHNRYQGILMHSGFNNTIVHNVMYNNTVMGLNIDNLSYNNEIAYNEIVGNGGTGIGCDEYCDGVSDNHIHHNNIVGNVRQAVDNGTNEWDDGYPSGGNYWSNYSGEDNLHGPNQDQPGADGIGDTRYVIDGDTVDRYPLMSPVPHDGQEPFEDNIGPSAVAGDNATILVNKSLTFNGDKSVDNAGIVNYTWSVWIVDGGSLGVWYTISFTHVFGEIGDYYAVLTVTDVGQHTDEDRRFVCVLSSLPEEGKVPYAWSATGIVLALISLALCLTYLFRVTRTSKELQRRG